MSADSTSRKAMTLLELLVVVGLLGLITVATSFILRQVLVVQRKVDREASLIHQFQTLGARLTFDVTASCIEGITVEPGRVAVLIPQRPAQFTGTQSYIVWRRHHVYYLESAAREVRWLDVPLTAATDVAAPLTPVPGSGGQMVARWVDSLEFEQDGPLLRMRISGSQPSSRGGVEKVDYSMAAHCRN
jgi:prepilin-type N-terminal cleavage/methylation domain-containing protein